MHILNIAFFHIQCHVLQICIPAYNFIVTLNLLLSYCNKAISLMGSSKVSITPKQNHLPLSVSNTACSRRCMCHYSRQVWDYTKCKWPIISVTEPNPLRYNASASKCLHSTWRNQSESVLPSRETSAYLHFFQTPDWLFLDAIFTL